MSDRFDHAARLSRVGVHRSHERTWWRWWMTAVCAVGACVLLIAGGLGALSLLRVADTPGVPAATQLVADPSTLPEGTTVTVLDASGSGAADAAVVQLQEAGWPVLVAAEADEAVTGTTVYYQGDLEPFALGIVEVIGTGSAAASAETISGSALTVVVGTAEEPQPSDAP